VIRFCRLSGESLWKPILAQCVAGDHPKTGLGQHIQPHVAA
jgi:hypothetical protein